MNVMSYYRISSKSGARPATARTPCDNCGRPFSEHRYTGSDRDGELHECTTQVATRTTKKHQAQYDLTTQLDELIVLAQREGLYDAADFVKQAMERRNTSRIGSAIDAAKAHAWATKHATNARQRARKKWGTGWNHLSHELRRGALAMEVIDLVYAQDEGHADAQTKKFQQVIRILNAENE